MELSAAQRRFAATARHDSSRRRVRRGSDDDRDRARLIAGSLARRHDVDVQDPSASGSTRRWVVANADGTKRDTVTLPPVQTPAGWLRGSTVLLASSGNLRRLRTMSLADGQSRVVEDGADVLLDPSWSPDGTRMATMARVPPHAELRIRNSDGSPQRTWPLSEIFASNTAWSPDQRWIAYIGSNDSPTARVGVVEVATGQTRQLLRVHSESIHCAAVARRLASPRPDRNVRPAGQRQQARGISSRRPRWPGNAAQRVATRSRAEHGDRDR